MQTSDALKNIRYSLHALAQPLAAVAGMVDLLLLEQPPDNPLYKEIQLISDKLEQILEIVAHMREITRAVSPSPAEAASFPAQDQPEP